MKKNFYKLFIFIKIYKNYFEVLPIISMPKKNALDIINYSNGIISQKQIKMDMEKHETNT